MSIDTSKLVQIFFDVVEDPLIGIASTSFGSTIRHLTIVGEVFVKCCHQRGFVDVQIVFPGFQSGELGRELEKDRQDRIGDLDCMTRAIPAIRAPEAFGTIQFRVGLFVQSDFLRCVHNQRVAEYPTEVNRYIYNS